MDRDEMQALDHPLVCKRCGVVVSRFRHRDGSVEWAHGRSWETFDHDPEPVPLGVVKLKLSCDFCGADDPLVKFTGDDISKVIPGAPEGQRWVACALCDRDVRRGNAQATARRAFLFPAVVKALAGTDPSKDEAVRQYYVKIHRSFIDSVRTREVLPEYLLNPKPLPKIRPGMLPKVRDRLVRWWSGEMVRRIVAGSDDDPYYLPGADMGHDDFVVETMSAPADAIDRFCARARNALQTADLLWVSTEFTVLAINAGKKLPDLTVRREEMPAPSGLIVYDQAIREVEVEGRQIEINALGWMLIPDGVWVTLYCRPEHALPMIDPSRVRDEIGFLLAAAPGAALQFQTYEKTSSGETAQQVWQTLLATWFLMNQPGVAEETEAEVDRATRKSYGRAGRSQPRVRVVDLRRHARAAHEPSEGGAGRSYSVRWIVGLDTGGYWNYYDLIANSVKCRCKAPNPEPHREKRWISPYLKGPAGAPLKQDHTEVVRALR